MSSTTKRKPGRPRNEFDQKTADRICDQIIEGKSLRRICAQKAMPTKKTVLRWLQEVPSFADQYAIATDARGDTYADYITELVHKANENNYNSTRVKIDALKWIASKLKPKKYGDRLGVDVQGEVTHNTGLWSFRGKPFLAWSHDERRNWARLQVYMLHTTAQALLHDWKLPRVAEACQLLALALARHTIDGVPEDAPRQALPAPEPEKPVEKIVNPEPGPPSTEPTTRARDSQGAPEVFTPDQRRHPSQRNARGFPAVIRRKP